MTGGSIDRLATVLVHHRNFPDVLETIDALLSDGCSPAAFVVVDNSEDDGVFAALEQALPAGITLVRSANEGYGPAVNVGLRRLTELTAAEGREYVLVSTHEARPRTGSIGTLVATLAADPALGVVGPALVMETPAGLVTWSLGGRLTPVLNEPRHRGVGVPPDVAIAEASRPCDWLDGAFCVYRRSALPPDPFRPDFFMYFEETELHTRLRKGGQVLACVPSAVVEQSSNGAPPYLLARNLQLFQNLHGRRRHRLLTVPLVIARKLVRKVVRGGPDGELDALFRGWRSAAR